MRKFLLAISVLCLSVALKAQNVFPDYVDGRIYVKFTSGALKAVAKDDPNNIPFDKLKSFGKVLTKYGVTKAYKPFYQADDDAELPYILKFEFSQKNKVVDFIRELSDMPGVEYAEKVPLTKTSVTPNDPGYPSQPFLPQINAPNAWNVFNGNSNITVAIVDNAVMWTHVDLVANTYTNMAEFNGTPGVDDDQNGYKDDINGWDVADNDNNAVPTNSAMSHGTHCAGIAGATNNNGIGIGSIGWNIKIIPVKCTYNTSGTIAVDNGYGGIIYAAKVKARIISCSWGGAGSSAAEQTVVNYAWNRGCLVIAAAGNSNVNTPNYPGAFNNVYCVASLSGTNTKSSFSNYGTTSNAWVDIAAPGENILSTVPYVGTPQYQQQSGTSMATPLVAGLAGLMLSKYPYMTQTDIINCINTTAANIYTIAANATYSTNLQLGKGRIEAFAAMNCAASFTTMLPIANFYTLTRNTCPNTLIAFQDSSLYGPTNYTWTFQGGTPATSTSSAPLVQWASPGIYSVTLIAGNANGTNTKIKTSYITISNPIALPLSEGFQNAAFLPIDWTSLNIGNDNVYWTRVTGFGGFTTTPTAACARFDNYNFDATGEKDEMRTPRYNFANVVAARLRFDVAYAQYDNQYSDTLNVKLSTNCGTSWTSIYMKGGSILSTNGTTLQASMFTPSVSPATKWRRDSVDISSLSAAQGNVMLSFVNRGYYGQALYLDNINLYFPVPTSNFNVPASACAGAVQTLTNSTTGAASYTWNFPGGSPLTSNAINPTVTYTAPGVYSVTINSQNGTSISSLTKTISVTYGNAISVTTPTICQGASASLVASGAATYTWNTGSNAANITPSPSVTTNYTVNGTNSGCISTKIAMVIVNPLPVVSANNQTICPGGTATITAAGATSYSWNTGFTGNPLTVSPSSNTNYTVTGTSNGCTNTKTVSVTVGSSLSVLITPSQQSVCAAGASTLTASGATSYTWNTGSNATSIVVNPTTTTTYSVLGSNGACNGNNTFNLTVISTPVINVSSNPVICNGNTATLTASGTYTTYVWSAPSTTATSIVVSPSVSTNYTVSASGSGGCSTLSVVAVTVNQNPTATISNTMASCSSCADGAASVTVTGNNPYSYTWTPANTNSPSINGVLPGCYTVNISDANSCVTQATTCVGFATGLTSSSVFEGLLVYPNPAQTLVKIEYNNTEFNFALYNNLGQLIIAQSKNKDSALLLTGELSKGVYTLVIEKGNEKTRKKLIIE